MNDEQDIINGLEDEITTLQETITTLQDKLADMDHRRVVMVDVHTSVCTLLLDLVANFNFWVKTHCRHAEWQEVDKILGQYGLRLAEINKKMDEFMP